MNKLLIVLLAVCLVSVHAFVRRDAPAEASSGTATGNDLGKQLDEFGKNAQEFFNKNGEAIKKQFGELAEKVGTFVNNLNKPEEKKS